VIDRSPRVLGVGGATLASAALGVAIGLLITWVLWPVEFTNAAPAELRQLLKDDYVRMISAAYELDGDVATAKQRLTQLELANPTQTFNDLIAQEKQTSGDPAIADALIHLAQAVGLKMQYAAQRSAPGSDGMPLVVQVVAVPTQPVAIFGLKEHIQLTCNDEPETAHLRVLVRDSRGRDLPNVGIQIHWANGDEMIYTGLKPERGVGYADFEAAPGTYSVTILNAQSVTVSDLVIGEAPANCKADRGATPRGWKLVFQQK